MNTNNYYPRVTVNLKNLKSNIDALKSLCGGKGISLVGVIKGMNGIPAATKVFDDAGLTYLGTSRLEQITSARKYGVKSPFMLIRIPMLSEVSEVVRLADISLNSEIVVLDALNKAAQEQGKIHKVILMSDLGDLREGYWDKGELVDVCVSVEKEFQALYLAGIGTNVSCYGSINPSVEKLNDLVRQAEAVEAKIGRKLDYISGGATTTLPRVMAGDIPARVNQIRLGESIIVSHKLPDLFGVRTDFLRQDAFVLEAEVIEVKIKPSYPQGEIVVDAFGMRPKYIDRGNRRRALLALGRVDFGFPEGLFPMEDGVTVLGASSDHTILDVEDAKRDIKVGDTVKFTMNYSSIVFVTYSENVKIFVNEG